MYHTKQSVHLQGGQRLNSVTTTSLLADVLERQWNQLKEEKREEIAKYTEAIARIDMANFKEKLEGKKSKPRKTKHSCEKYDFKSNFLYQVHRHMELIHKSKPEKKVKRVHYDSDTKGRLKKNH